MLHRKNNHPTLQYIALLLLSSVFSLLYCKYSGFWSWTGGISGSLWLFELPVILIFCFLLYLPTGWNSISRWLAVLSPVVTVLGMYLLYDITYRFFFRSPRVSDLVNISHLFKSNPSMFWGLICCLGALILPFIYNLFQVVSTGVKARNIAAVLFRIVCLVLFVVVLFSPASFTYQKSMLQFNTWSDVENVKKNGRIASFLWYHMLRGEALEKLPNYIDSKQSDVCFRGRVTGKRNVHIIMLESFLDPRAIKGLLFNRSPLSSELSPYLLPEDRFSTIISPVYGSATAQAEFEILTGAPALSLFGSVEFNYFDGSPVNGLIPALRRNKYQDLASIGTQPGYYNSMVAYRALGLSRLYYLDYNAYFSKDPHDEYIFDGDLLSANIEYLKNNLLNRNEGKGVFNYVLGMYGHHVYRRNLLQRPDVVSIKPDIPKLHRIANQFFYRTKALGRYLRELQCIDPDSIVIVVSDHLPPIIDDRVEYSYSEKTNIAIMLDGFTPVDVSGKHSFELPHILWNILRGHENPLNLEDVFDGNDPVDVYFNLLAQAMGKGVKKIL